jgi:hypothetical protein
LSILTSLLGSQRREFVVNATSRGTIVRFSIPSQKYGLTTVSNSPDMPTKQGEFHNYSGDAKIAPIKHVSFILAIFFLFLRIDLP